MDDFKAGGMNPLQFAQEFLASDVHRDLVRFFEKNEICPDCAAHAMAAMVGFLNATAKSHGYNGNKAELLAGLLGKPDAFVLTATQTMCLAAGAALGVKVSVADGDMSDIAEGIAEKRLAEDGRSKEQADNAIAHLMHLSRPADGKLN